MTYRTLILLGLLAGGGSAAWAQAPARPATPARQQAEDIEVLRRILQKKVMASPQLSAAGRSCRQCHSRWPVTQFSEMQSPTGEWRLAESVNYYSMARAFSADGKTLWSTHGQPHPAQATHVEGHHLKGHGLVFSLTLPTPSQDPRQGGAASAPTPLSDWEKTRQDVRGQKVEPRPAEPQPQPALAEIILRVLADNSKHLSQLLAEENITVVVTFRGEKAAAAAASANRELVQRIFVDLLGRRPTAEELEQFSQDTSPQARAKLIDALLAAPFKPDLTANAWKAHLDASSSAGEYELLGDLHLKQGRYQEAARAYEKAAGQRLTPAEKAEIYRKMAQAYLAAKDLKRAQEALEEINLLKADAGKPAAAEPASRTTPLPAKLTITAPKKLLDLAGAGKITWEEFKKAASVDFQTFE